MSLQIVVCSKLHFNVRWIDPPTTLKQHSIWYFAVVYHFSKYYLEKEISVSFGSFILNLIKINTLDEIRPVTLRWIIHLIFVSAIYVKAFPKR